MRVLLVEDDAAVTAALTAMLRAEAMVVDHAPCGEDAVELGKHYDYDIILLDLLLPDLDGYEVVRHLRASRKTTPVMILSGMSRPQAKVKGFVAGADDFVTKPFDRDELIARMQAVIRRSKGYSHSKIQFGNISLNIDNHDVFVGEDKLHLTGKEYAIFELLVLRKGMILTKEAFLNHLYGGLDEPEAKIIDVFICKLRKKLALSGVPNVIETVWGRGYTIREETRERQYGSNGKSRPDTMRAVA